MKHIIKIVNMVILLNISVLLEDVSPYARIFSILDDLLNPFTHSLLFEFMAPLSVHEVLQGRVTIHKNDWRPAG